jgi:hypothetical protein
MSITSDLGPLPTPKTTNTLRTPTHDQRDPADLSGNETAVGVVESAVNRTQRQSHRGFAANRRLLHAPGETYPEQMSVGVGRSLGLRFLGRFPRFFLFSGPYQFARPQCLRPSHPDARRLVDVGAAFRSAPREKQEGDQHELTV